MTSTSLPVFPAFSPAPRGENVRVFTRRPGDLGIKALQALMVALMFLLLILAGAGFGGCGG